MTKPKPLSDSKRPRRLLGSMLRDLCRCPLCAEKNLRVVAYRRRTVRLECGDCGLRFSLDVFRFTLAFIRSPDLVRNADPMTWAMVASMAEVADLTEGTREIIGEAGMRALEAHGRAIGTWDAFVEKANAKAKGDTDG